MAASSVHRAPSVCARVLLKYLTSRQVISSRSLSNVTKAEIKDSSSKTKQSLYDTYLEKKSKESQIQRPGLGPEFDDLLVSAKEERKKIVRKDLHIKLEKREWTEESVRAGAVGVKLGMSTLWRKDGKRIIVSLIQLKDCQVMDSRLGFEDGGDNHHTEVIIGAVNLENLSKITERLYGEYVKYGIPPKTKLNGFKCTKDAILPSGTTITAAHFSPGQYLRISGISQDLGFQGVMKRWGMKGQPASHGQTKTHRKMGATGGGGTPGRVFPGKKMAGHMGGNRMLLPSVMVYRINTKYNIMYVSGQIPGAVGDFVKIQDSRLRKAKFKTPPPFPTYIADPENPLPDDIYSESVHLFSDESVAFSGDT